MEKEKQFTVIISENKEKISRICRRYLDDEDVFKDVYQEVLINIWKNLETFRGESSISTWIYRIAVNTCLLSIRSEKRRKDSSAKGIRLENLPAQVIVEDQGHEDLSEKKVKFFKNFLNLLSLSDRALVSLYLEELTTKEMADVTGLSESNVRVKIFRIKEQIKEKWEEGENGTR